MRIVSLLTIIKPNKIVAKKLSFIYDTIAQLHRRATPNRCDDVSSGVFKF